MGLIQRAIPFRGMPKHGWTRLACAALATCYLLQLGFEVAWHNTCGHLAIDYCALWSAERVAGQIGYARIYDPAALRSVEASITPLSSGYAFEVVPIPYLPVFIVPLQFLSRIDPRVGYWLWAVANLCTLMIYLWFFARRTAGKPVNRTLLGFCVLSLPVYWNFFNGQVNVWLVICVGEVLRASLAGRPLHAGLWLGGLLLKPQLLLLIVPILLLQRAFKMIGGLVVSSLAVLAASWLVIGWEGFGRLIGLWLGYSRGLPTNDVGIMMNWRMLGAAIGALSWPLLGWIVILTGLTVTLAAAFYLGRRHINFRSGDSIVVWLGVWAAALLFAWHSHVHMSVILLPALLYLAVTKRISSTVINLWVILPALLYFAAFLAAGLLRAGILPASFAPILDFARGAGAFAVTILLLTWAVRKISTPRLEESANRPQLARHIA